MIEIKQKTKEEMTHLFDDYYLDADEKQYVLKRAVTRKNRKNNEQYEAMETLGYYGTIGYALKQCVIFETRNGIEVGNFKEISDLINYIEALTNRVESLVIV